MSRRPAAEILLIAVEEIGRLLSDAPAQDQDLITACDPWTIRDVLAHCSGSMLRVIEDRTHGFTPDENEIDVEELVLKQFERIQDELFREVHLLARCYHWSESEILSRPPWRRARYLAFIERDGER